MIEVVIFAEGPTEELFIKRVVAPALRDLRIFLKAETLKTSQEARAGAETPEHINNSFETKPSQRLKELLHPQYRKTLHGPLAAERITLAVMERECPHFRKWLDRLRALKPC